MKRPLLRIRSRFLIPLLAVTPPQPFLPPDLPPRPDGGRRFGAGEDEAVPSCPLPPTVCHLLRAFLFFFKKTFLWGNQVELDPALVSSLLLCLFCSFSTCLDSFSPRNLLALFHAGAHLLRIGAFADWCGKLLLVGTASVVSRPILYWVLLNRN